MKSGVGGEDNVARLGIYNCIMIISLFEATMMNFNGSIWKGVRIESRLAIGGNGEVLCGAQSVPCNIFPHDFIKKYFYKNKAIIKLNFQWSAQHIFNIHLGSTGIWMLNSKVTIYFSIFKMKKKAKVSNTL